MAKQVKLQDTLEIFLEKLSDTEKSLDITSGIVNQIDLRLKQISQTAVKLDTTEAEKMLQNSKKDMQSVAESISKTSADAKADLEKTIKKAKSFFNVFGYVLLGLFLTSVTSVSVSLNLYFEKKELNKEKTYYRSNAYRMYSFIKENELLPKYEKWQENKNVRKKK